MKLGEKESGALRPDAQAFDEVRIVTVPRYKTSGLSGDEWRISAHIEFYRKGVKVHESGGLRNVETACGFVYAEHCKGTDEGHAYFASEKGICDQEGCSERATLLFKLKKLFCRSGHGTEPMGIETRQFCEQHKRRGDCALEDADSNYELLRTL
jgi:hypothetical protein